MQLIANFADREMSNMCSDVKCQLSMYNSSSSQPLCIHSTHKGQLHYITLQIF